MRRPTEATQTSLGGGESPLARAVLKSGLLAGALALALTACRVPISTVRSAHLNLLSTGNLIESFGIIREQRLTDGRVPGPGQPIDDFGAALVTAPDAFVLYDLGTTRTLGLIELVSTDRSPTPVSLSIDGLHYERIELEAPRSPRGLALRSAAELNTRARYLRLQSEDSSTPQAYAELRAFAPGSPVPPLVLQKPHAVAVAQLLGRMRRLHQGNLAAILFAGTALALSLRARAGSRRVVLLLVALGAAGWLRYGLLHGDGTFVHPWDASHYYLGSKYSRELGYTELYRCIAQWERERGRGAMIDRERVRDLESNELRAGAWTSTAEGSCQAAFTLDRWRSFGNDVDRFRRMFRYRHFHRLLADHGYNATPFQTAWLSLLTRAVPVGDSSLVALASLDLAAMTAAIGALAWGFGAPAAAAASLLIGFGDPWSFSWTGGSIARLVWLTALCGGLASLRRDRPFLGGTLITVAALLRLFPVVFVGALLLKVVVDRVRCGSLQRTGRRVLAGIGSTVVAGMLLVSAAPGMSSLPAFVRNTHRQATVPPGNHIGFGVLASVGSGVSALGASGDSQPLDLRGIRLSFWALAGLLSLAYLIRRLLSGCSFWETIPLSAPLLFASVPTGGYDYVWLAVLAPAALTAGAIGFAPILVLPALTQILALATDRIEIVYPAVSVAVLGALLWVARLSSRRTGGTNQSSPGCKPKATHLVRVRSTEGSGCPPDPAS